jgi:hypothetical protein
VTLILGAVTYWHWWAFGGALAIIEAFVSGFVFLWLGIAAGVVGTLLWLWPGIGPDYQVLLFAVLSVASVHGWRRWRSAHPALGEQPNLNRRGARMSAASSRWSSRSATAAAGSGSATAAGRSPGPTCRRAGPSR